MRVVGMFTGETGMPFYLRKSVSVGPFRFNLSKSGVGISAGVKGFRVGTGPKGNYVHMGRGGFYYRASLDAPKPQSAPQPQQPSVQIFPEGQQEIESGNVLDMVPAKAEDVIGQINEKLDRFSLWPVSLVLGLLGCYFVNDALHDDMWLGTSSTFSNSAKFWPNWLTISRSTSTA